MLLFTKLEPVAKVKVTVSPDVVTTEDNVSVEIIGAATNALAGIDGAITEPTVVIKSIVPVPLPATIAPFALRINSLIEEAITLTFHLF